MNGKTDFYRTWSEYSVGFGNLSEEFWLGKVISLTLFKHPIWQLIRLNNLLNLYLDLSLVLGNQLLHNLTNVGPVSLRVDMRSGNESAYAHYANFSVDSVERHYTLTVSGYTGTAGKKLLKNIFFQAIAEFVATISM